ncbi:MAG: L,D-transpeptidase family protein [Actinomycetota bacterium]|jgi:N-acetylmuramoyl-L-alanine amidase
MTTEPMRSATLFLLGAVVAGTLAIGPNAVAQGAPTVTLGANRTVIVFGRSVTLFGRIRPRAAGETVNIVKEGGRRVASATTDERGRYRVSIEPHRNMVLRAQWVAAVSDPVRLKVRPILHVSLGPVRLFGRTRVRGTLRPIHKGDRVNVALRRNGKVIRRRAVRLSGLSFSTRFHIRHPGSYAAVVRFNDADHAGAGATSASRATPLPALSRGSRSAYVTLLERRLRSLGYYLPRADRTYDSKTYDAVIAFNKVQRRLRSGNVVESTWKALADPRRPRARSRAGGFHIEIDQTKQVVYTVWRGRVANVLHTSTGAGGATRDGSYRVFRKVNGYSGGGLYYPSYFDGLRAIHGWREVPTYPASHGCARVPMWAAQWIYGKAKLGTRVLVYH